MARKYGLINEDYFTLRSPRVCDEGGFDSVAEAMAKAVEMIEDGCVQEVAIVVARYSLKHDCWFEMANGCLITVDASNFEPEEDEPEEDEDEERNSTPAQV